MYKKKSVFQVKSYETKKDKLYCLRQQTVDQYDFTGNVYYRKAIFDNIWSHHDLNLWPKSNQFIIVSNCM